MSTRVRRLALSIPLDSDGYLRRECPNCERDFKRLVNKAPISKSAQTANGGHFCPYCGLQSPSNNWLTKAQVEFTRRVAAEHVAPAKSHLGLRSLNLRAMRSAPSLEDELSETDDMRIVNLPCHPTESIKVSELWIGSIHCPVCANRISI